MVALGFDDCSWLGWGVFYLLDLLFLLFTLFFSSPFSQLFTQLFCCTLPTLKRTAYTNTAGFFARAPSPHHFFPSKYFTPVPHSCIFLPVNISPRPPYFLVNIRPSTHIFQTANIPLKSACSPIHFLHLYICFWFSLLLPHF